jgi:hypothetical protein
MSSSSYELNVDDVESAETKRQVGQASQDMHRPLRLISGMLQPLTKETPIENL